MADKKIGVFAMLGGCISSLTIAYILLHAGKKLWQLPYLTYSLILLKKEYIGFFKDEQGKGLLE